jgi:hypothetical protein
MRNSADVAYTELYRYKVSHLKHGEAVLKVGHPVGRRSRFLSGMTTRKIKARTTATADSLRE